MAATDRAQRLAPRSDRQTSGVVKAVLYAAKSTEDVHGSIPTQLNDCRACAAREGWEIVDEFTDEAFSAYSGNRGPGLEQAKSLAAALAAEHGGCVLVAQDADRFARGAGDAPGAADHLGEVYFAMNRQGVELWTVRSGRLDLLRAAIEGERSHDESQRKSQAVAAGHRRRWESKKRLGSPIADGFRLEAVLDAHGQVQVGRDSRAIRDVALDPERAPIWERIFVMVEFGHTCGDIQRTLNAEGIRKQRGGQWRTRDIRKGVVNDWYCGRAHAYGETIENDHPALIEPARWERIAAMVRTDQRASKGGRPALAEGADYLLRGLANCGLCGEPLWPRRLASGRHYCCKAVREARGTCNAPHIPAEEVEQAVLDHLGHFVASVEDWLKQRTAQADADRDRFAEMIDGERAALRTLSRRVEAAHAQYERLLGDDDKLADAALRKATGFESEREALATTIAAAEERLAEWPAADVDQALDVYAELQEAVAGRVRGSQSLQDLRATLRATLAYVVLDYAEGGLFGTFGMRLSPELVERHRPHLVQMLSGAAEDRWAGMLQAQGDDSPPGVLSFGRFPDKQRADVCARVASAATGTPLQEEPATTC